MPWPLVAGLVAALALLAAVSWMGRRQSVRVQETRAWVARTYELALRALETYNLANEVISLRDGAEALS